MIRKTLPLIVTLLLAIAIQGFTTEKSKGYYLNTRLAYGSGATVLKHSKSDPLIADFSADKTNGIAPLTVNFTDASTGGATTWSWDFDNDGSEDANTQNPTYTYSTVGAYTVKLTISDGTNSKDTTFINYIHTINTPTAFETDWSWLNPLPQGNIMNKSFKVSSTVAYVAGQSGTLLKTTDGGNNWDLLHIINNDWLNTVYFLNENTGFVGGSEGTIYKTLDGGISWYEIENNIPSYSAVYDLWFFNENEGIAVTHDGKIYKTANGGYSWNNISHPGTSKYKNDVYFIDNNIGFVVGGNSTTDILKTTDGGETWKVITTSVTTKNLHSIVFVNSTTGFISGDEGTILKTTDAGETWSAYTHSETVYTDFYSIVFTDASNGYTAGDYAIYKTTDGGSTWTKNYSKYNSDDFKTIVFMDANKGFVFGENGIINKTVNAGTDWTSETTGTDDSFKAIDFISASTGYAVTNGDSIYKTTDKGDTWTSTSASTYYLNDINVYNTDSVIAVGSSGKVIISNNGGSSWETKTSGITKSLYGVQATTNNTIYAVGYKGNVIKSTDAGETWNSMTSPYDKTLYDLHFTDNNNGIVIGGSFGVAKIFKTTDGGSSWTEITSPIQKELYAITYANTDTLYICGEDGLVLRSVNNGDTWTQQTIPIPSSAYYLPKLYDIHFIDGKTGIIVGSTNSIYKTTDAGVNWILDTTIITSNYIYGVHMIYPTRIIAGGMDGVLLKYKSADDPVEDVVAAFSADKTTGDAPLEVTFTDASTGTPTTWSWDFDNNGTVDATTQNPTYTYTAAGTYTVKLTIGDGTATDNEIKTDYITVSEAPNNLVAAFSADKTTGDAPLEVTFTDASTGGATTWSWDFDNNGSTDATTQNPTYTYSTAGTYTVKLTIGDGTYTDDTVMTDYITVTAEDNGFDLSSSDFITNFEDSEDLTGWTVLNENSDSHKWEFDGTDGINGTKNAYYSFNSSNAADDWLISPSLQMVTTKTYEVNFYYEANSSTYTEKLKVMFGNDKTAAAMVNTVVDLGEIGNTEYLKSTTVITVPSDGKYNVGWYCYSSTSGWVLRIDSIRINEATATPLTAAFSADKTSGEAPLEVTFTDASTGGATTWNWDFDNNGTIDATTQNPTYTYSTAGTYTVKLTVGNGTNNDDEVKTDYITVTDAGGNDCLDPTDYVMNFETNDDFAGWNFLDANNDGSKWGIFSSLGINNTQAAAYEYNAGNGADDWLFSPCFDLVEGKKYEISFYYAAKDPDYSEKLKLFYGTEANATMNNLIVDLGEFDNGNFEKSTSEITISETNAYHFGWYCYSDADRYYAIIDSVHVKEATVTAVNENANKNMKVYPNPANNSVTVEFGTSLSSNNTITIYDLNGKQVYCKTTNGATKTINISAFEKGIYLIKVVNEFDVKTNRLIVN